MGSFPHPRVDGRQPCWFRSSGSVPRVSANSSHFTRTTVWPGSAFWEQLAARGRRRFRKLKWASRLKLFLLLPLLLLLGAALSRSSSAPSARSPAARRWVQHFKRLKNERSLADTRWARDTHLSPGRILVTRRRYSRCEAQAPAT